VARWREPERRIPAAVARYDKRIHGGGVEGVRAWKRAALGWLAAHPGESVGGMDVLGVLRECCRLMGQEPGTDFHPAEYRNADQQP